MKGLAYVLGGLDKSLYVLFLVLVIDVITNICFNIYNKKTVKINKNVIINKFGYLLVLLLAVGIDLIMSNANMIRTMIIYFFITSHSITILMKWNKMGVPLPHKIFDVINDLKEESDGSKDGGQEQNS